MRGREIERKRERGKEREKEREREMKLKSSYTFVQCSYKKLKQLRCSRKH